MGTRSKAGRGFNRMDREWQGKTAKRVIDTKLKELQRENGRVLFSTKAFEMYYIIIQLTYNAICP